MKFEALFAIAGRLQPRRNTGGDDGHHIMSC